ncbi:type IV toxin-antitoxin system AbiEi family antitoxin domain-containing protein [Lachnoclostridium edouardi]|uniref:type IV toxin-antitoxin system AbiEi family antitoxin domain-containing protein n=1 Tax=Lachnoclostridium edouardi TaxID=1926283 RepID=UPI000C7E21E4|nr:hypothetical protein [Lachnoclostridium edouardi]
MLEYYEKLLQIKCFSFYDAVKILGDKQKTRNILYMLKKKGLLQSIRRNYYVVISLETKEPVASPFEIASAITADSYISHHSALEFYGLTNQVFSDVFVSTERVFREFDFDGRWYRCIENTRKFGIVQQKRIKVTDLERTILDSIKDFDKIGGLEELLRCLEMITVINEDILIAYLGKYHNQFLSQKAGYLLSFFPRIKLSSSFFSFCKANMGNSSRYLYHDLKDEKNMFVKEWNLCVPENILQLINEGGEAFV